MTYKNHEYIHQTNAENTDTKRMPGKMLIAFTGISGSGKSTQISNLRTLGAPVFHVGKFAKELGVSNEKTRRRGGLLQGLDEPFLQHVSQAPESFVILDGFPRTKKQTRLLCQLAEKEGWNLQVINLVFPPNHEVRQSYRRQIARAKEEGKSIDRERVKGKAKRAFTYELPAIAALMELGVSVYDVDCLQPAQIITRQIREFLNLDFESIPFERDILKLVSQVSQDLGIAVWAGGGMLYRPFWNAVYGPMQESTDKDLVVIKREDITPVLEKLHSSAPHIRWSVHSRLKDGESADTLPDIFDIQNSPLTFRHGALRMVQGNIELILAPGAEADLRNGVVRFDEQTLASMSEDARTQYITESPAIIHKTLEEYPGLTILGRLVELYEKQYGKHIPVRIIRDWNVLQKEVWEEEYGGRPIWDPTSFTEREIQLAKNVRMFYLTAEKTQSAPPHPNLSRLPGILEEIRQANKHKGIRSTEIIPPPEGYHDWLQYTIFNSPDAEFKEWFLNQRRSRYPLGGRNAVVQNVMEFVSSTERRKIANESSDQKITHMGFRLHKHLEEAVYQLNTDQLLPFLSKHGLSYQQVVNIRANMRLAMLYHDIGKVYNINTPGAHEGIGSKLFLQLKPSWLQDQASTMIAWMIRTHDLFGRLARGITEKEEKKITDSGFDVSSMPRYSGALDPKTVRLNLRASGFTLPLASAIHKSIWTADVGSVSALRWLLPIADILETMILADDQEIPIPMNNPRLFGRGF